MKRILNSLLFKVFCGIVIGIVIGIFNIEWLNRLLLTFKGLFGNFLGFTIPLIMMGLIMPAISDLGKNSGKLLLITVAIAYAFTLFSGFSTYFVSDALFPSLLQGEQLKVLEEQQASTLTPYFLLYISYLCRNYFLRTSSIYYQCILQAHNNTIYNAHSAIAYTVCYRRKCSRTQSFQGFAYNATCLCYCFGYFLFGSYYSRIATPSPKDEHLTTHRRLCNPSMRYYPFIR